MALTKEQIVRIEEVAKSILLSRIESFPIEVAALRNAPFHDAFLDAFRDKLESVQLSAPHLVALGSWLHGLNTSLGTGFESIAHILSGGFKRKFTKEFRLQVKEPQAARITQIINDLKSGVRSANLAKEDEEIKSLAAEKGELVDALEFTVDNYVESDHEVECIEMKSVRPNSGEGRGEKQKILYAKAALLLQHPEKSVRFYIAFPFDPTSSTPTGYDTKRFMEYLVEFQKFFDPDEVLISSQLWDHLSGEENTMDALLDVVAEVASKVRG